MKVFLLNILCLYSGLVNAQYSFEKNYQFFSGISQNSNGILEDGSGGFFLTSTAYHANYATAIVSHLNMFGDTIWCTKKTLSPYVINFQTYCGAITRTFDGNLLVHGNIGDSTSIFDVGHWLLKIDTSGTIQWYKENFNTFLNFQFNENQDYIIEFNNKEILVYINQGFYALFDSVGNFISAKFPQILGSNIGNRKLNIKKSNSYFTLHGRKVINHYNENILFKLNFQGDTISTLLTAEDSLYFGGMEYSKFNNNWYYLIGRQSNIVGPGPSGDIITKLDSLGNIIYRKRYKNSFPNGLTFNCIKETADTGLIVGGFKGLTGIYVPYLYKFDSNGDSIWYKEYGNGANSNFFNLISSSDGSIVAIGEIKPVGSNTSYSYIVKTDANGDILNGEEELKKKDQSYIHVYPNPAFNYTFIHYLGKPNAALQITNLQGQVLFSQTIDTSNERIQVNTNKLEAGYYLCSIRSSQNLIVTKKLVVLK